MSHFLTFVTNANGIVVDPQMPDEIAMVMTPTFALNDVHIYRTAGGTTRRRL